MYAGGGVLGGANAVALTDIGMVFGKVALQ